MLFLELVSVAILAWIFLEETVNVTQIAGAIFIVLSVAMTGGRSGLG